VKRIRLSTLRAAASHRPSGYEQAVMARGRVDGEFLLLEDDVYQTLSNRYRRKPSPSSGPGTELKKLLKSVGIEAKPDCSCNKRAQLMDQNEAREPGWCEAHIEEISGWLQEEAKKRGLPYIASAGKLLIRIAIKRAKKGNGSV